MVGVFWKVLLKEVVVEAVRGVAHEVPRIFFRTRLDGKWDRRFNGGEDHPTKKDGTLDMRYKCNWGLDK